MNNAELDFALALSEVSGLDEAKRLFGERLAQFGVEQFIYGVLPRDSDGQITDVLSVDTLSPEWMTFYVENNLFQGDYAAWASIVDQRPVIFEDMYKNIDLGKIDARFKSTADFCRDWGIYNGITIPIHSYDRMSAVISLIYRSDSSRENYMRLFSLHNKDLMRVVSTFHAYINSIEFAQDYYGVTNREGEMLRWLADGLLAKEIAHKTGTSIHTVQKQIASAKTRLRSATATQAVAKATMLRLI